MSKLLGLDYAIQYRKGKEIIVADAMSRCHEEGSVAAISQVIPEWYNEVIDSYGEDEKIKGIIKKLTVGTQGEGEYTLSGGLLRRHGRLVIGDDTRLKKKIMQSLHESPLGDIPACRALTCRLKGYFIGQG